MRGSKKEERKLGGRLPEDPPWDARGAAGAQTEGRKRKQKEAEGVRERLEGEFGPGQAPTAAEAEAALRNILEEEKTGKVYFAFLFF